MANRLLRDWTASEAIDKLSEEAEVFFTRLIMKADDHGCYYGNAKLLKAALFPLRDHGLSSIKAWRDECVAAGILQSYTIGDKEYIKIINFGQRMRSFVSKFPQPADIPPTNDGGSRTLVSNPPPEGKRIEVEEEGKEKVTPAPTFEEIKNSLFGGGEQRWVDEMTRLYGKWGPTDFDKCYQHHANGPAAPVATWQWKQKFGTWLSIKNDRAADKETKPPEAFKKFDEAEYNKTLWVLPEWEKFYSWRLKNEPDFRNHFGYGKLQESTPVDGNSNGQRRPKGTPSGER